MLAKPKLKYGVSLTRWVFPGGTFEDGESPVEAAQREGFEEVSLTGKNGLLLGHQKKKSGRYHFFILFKDFDGVPANAEPHKHKAIQWVDLEGQRSLYYKRLPSQVIQAMSKNGVFKPR